MIGCMCLLVNRVTYVLECCLLAPVLCRPASFARIVLINTQRRSVNMHTAAHTQVIQRQSLLSSFLAISVCTWCLDGRVVVVVGWFPGPCSSLAVRSLYAGCAPWSSPTSSTRTSTCTTNCVIALRFAPPRLSGRRRLVGWLVG